jgi:hypothetical protein
MQSTPFPILACHPVDHRVAAWRFAIPGRRLAFELEACTDQKARLGMQARVADNAALVEPRPRRDTGRLEIPEGKAQNRLHVLPGKVARRISRQVNVRAIVSIKHDAGDKPEIAVDALEQSDRPIGLHGPPAELLHHPIRDQVILRAVSRENQGHM